MRAAILIPFKAFDKTVKRCVEACRRLDFPDYEIVLLPDQEMECGGVRVIATGPIKPSAKRNRGIAETDSELIALVDADAYPEKGWLKNAARHLARENVGAVGGPNLTPPDDSLMQKAGGYVLASLAGGGPHAFKYRIGKQRAFPDLPSCNLILKRSCLDSPAFDESLLTGEDVKLCKGIREKGGMVLYAPDVIVYHSRRPLFAQHLRQMLQYGMNRGQLVKTRFDPLGGPANFAPSALAVYAVGGAVLLLRPETAFLYVAPMALYLMFVLGSSVLVSPSNAPLVFIGTIATHFAYGIGFLRGFCVK